MSKAAKATDIPPIGPIVMPEKTVAVCDVFPGARDVKRVRIVMVLADGDLALGATFFDLTCNLSQRARDRARLCLDRVVHPVHRKRRKGDE